MNWKTSAAAFALSFGLATAASAAQTDLGTVVPGVDITHSRSFSGVLDDTLIFTIAADTGKFGGAITSAIGFDLETIDGFSATLTGPNGYSADWNYLLVPLSNPYEALSGGEPSLKAGTYALHITGTGTDNDGYFLRLGAAAAPVPEPASALMALAGLSVMAGLRRRRTSTEAAA